jgi:hypothetical protein
MVGPTRCPILFIEDSLRQAEKTKLGRGSVSAVTTDSSVFPRQRRRGRLAVGKIPVTATGHDFDVSRLRQVSGSLNLPLLPIGFGGSSRPVTEVDQNSAFVS